MGNFTSNIRRIVGTETQDAKPRIGPGPTHKPSLTAQVGIGSSSVFNGHPDQLKTNDTFDVHGTIEGSVGPTLAQPKLGIAGFTGLIDFGTSQAPDSFGAQIILQIKMVG